MSETDNIWGRLFSLRGDGQRVVKRLLTKRGRPLMLLPEAPSLAACCLDLYPAQTSAARCLRAILRGFLSISLPIGVPRIVLRIAEVDPLLGVLRDVTASKAGEIPDFAVLAGNPAHDSQRFILLVFDATGQPAAVVKLGASERARRLVEDEIRFLQSVRQPTRGIPRIRNHFTSSYWNCFAMDYFAGRTPAGRDEARIPELLTAWVDPGRTIRLADSADWVTLEGTTAASERLHQLALRVGERSFHPAIQHGDFAPWNVKVSLAGDWMALDWERGRLPGIPAWDWFHYVIQTALLVERNGTAALLQRIEELLASPRFRMYADAAGIAGVEKQLLLGYLLHCAHVLKPAEGLATLKELNDAAFQRFAA
jgi:hypothetical protein